MLNADGIVGQTGELLGHNLYMYCKNNPVVFKDPTGFRYTIATSYYEEKYILNNKGSYNKYKVFGNTTYKDRPQKMDLVDLSTTYGYLGISGSTEIHTPEISQNVNVQGTLGGNVTVGFVVANDGKWTEGTLGLELTPITAGIKLSGGYLLFAEVNIQGTAGIGGSGTLGYVWDSRNKMYGVSVGGAVAEAIGIRGNIKIWLDY